MEDGDKGNHGQAADVGEGSIPDGGSLQGLLLCLREWGPAAWAWGTETVLHEDQAGEAPQGARIGVSWSGRGAWRNGYSLQLPQISGL